MIIERDFIYKNIDVNLSLYDTFGHFGNFAIPINLSWSKIGHVFSISITIFCIAFHIEIWNIKGIKDGI